MHNFRELKVWQKSMELSFSIYKITENFPAYELYGLLSQMRRAAVSVASNIAEGAGRESDAEFSHFLDIARGSSFELETQLIIANKLNYTDHQEETDILKKEIIEIQRMISGLKQTIK